MPQQTEPIALCWTNGFSSVIDGFQKDKRLYGD